MTDVLTHDFSACTLKPLIDQEGNKWKTHGFYLDSTGRACISIPLELTFPSEAMLKGYMENDYIQPKPNVSQEGGGASKEDGENKQKEGVTASSSLAFSRACIAIESKVTLTVGTGEAIVAVVEQVKVISTEISSATSVVYETDIIVRVSRGTTASVDANVKLNLEISAVLYEQQNWTGDHVVTAIASLTSVVKAGHHSLRTKTTRTKPFTLITFLTQALLVQVENVSGPGVGKTYLALTIRHSNTHKEPLTVTRITLHPAQEAVGTTWGYAARCNPNLPFPLQRLESFSTILTVDASQDIQCRSFSCPVSVTAVLGRRNNSSDTRYEVLTTANAECTTSQAAVEPADGFGVDLHLQTPNCYVGAPVTVQVKVRNLSSERRNDLVLLVTNDDADRESELALPYGRDAPKEVHVAEKDGYKFGIRGLSMTEELNDQLIALDVAYQLPGIDAKSSAEAELRFIPLREGLVYIPDLQIYDRVRRQRYMCFHKLRATVQASSK